MYMSSFLKSTNSSIDKLVLVKNEDLNKWLSEGLNCGFSILIVNTYYCEEKCYMYKNIYAWKIKTETIFKKILNYLMKGLKEKIISGLNNCCWSKALIGKEQNKLEKHIEQICLLKLQDM